MKKIPTLLQRNPEDRRYVTEDLTPGCEWVLAGEGVPTRKYDGTCMMLDRNGWWARREVKPGKSAPPGWVFADHDDATGKSVGWEPVEQSPFSKFHMEALSKMPSLSIHPGTYELVGPKINGNSEHCDGHILIRHADAEVLDLTEDGDGPWTVDDVVDMVNWARVRGWEGIVWHHPDGRMAKLKGKDFPA